MDGPERSPHAKLSCELKNSFFSEVSRAFVPVRMLSANHIAEKSQYALSEEDKQNDLHPGSSNYISKTSDSKLSGATLFR